MGDLEGCALKDGVVTTPSGFKEAYRQYCEGGWNGLTADPEYGIGVACPADMGDAEVVAGDRHLLCLQAPGGKVGSRRCCKQQEHEERGWHAMHCRAC